MADKLLTMCPDIVFIGNMNCFPKTSDTIKRFCEIYKLKNLMTSPTCYKGQSPTILDIILVSQPKRFTESLNCECPLSDFHNIIGGTTKQYARFEKPRKIYYRSYKKFDDNEFIKDISNVPFHVGEIFDDIDDLSWFTSSLLIDIINVHAPVKSKILKHASVPYMNSQLRKSIYRRNMTRNKFRKYGSTYWEDNRIQRNKVVAIRKASITKYFSQKCSSHDKSFWSTVSPIMNDKRHRNVNNFMFYDPSPPRMFLSLDLLSEYRIQHGAIGPLYVTSSYSTWIFCRGVSGFATVCSCDVWCRGLTTCLLHVGPPFGNRFLNNSLAVGLTYWTVYLQFFCILIYAIMYVLIHHIIFGFIFTS